MPPTDGVVDPVIVAAVVAAAADDDIFVVFLSGNILSSRAYHGIEQMNVREESDYSQAKDSLRFVGFVRGVASRLHLKSRMNNETG